MSNPSIARIRATLEHQRDRVLDLDIHVDQCRSDVDEAMIVFRDAVRERDAAARHLAQLETWLDDGEAA